MHKFAFAVSAALLSACSLSPSVSAQLDTMCGNVRAAHSVLAGTPLPTKAQQAFDAADAICANPPKDVASAIVSLAAAYFVISKVQAKVK